MTALDSTGVREFEDLAKKLNASGRVMILCGTREQPLKLIRQSELVEQIGAANICENINVALSRARNIVEGTPHNHSPQIVGAD
jgi:SulP family sulfate permease